MFVYLVTNRISGRKYVGITTGTISGRWKSHVSAAHRGCNFTLARAIRKYGSDTFDVSELEKCPDFESLNSAERKWIEAIGTFSAGYNMTIGGGGTTGIKRSDEFKRMISDKHRGRTYSEETLRKMSEAKKGKRHPDHCYDALRARRGIKRDPEIGRKISAALKGRKLSEKQIQFLREIRIGKRLSESAKNAISRPVIANGVEYKSLSAAANSLGVSCETVSRRIRDGLNGYNSIVPRRTRAKRSAEQRLAMRVQASKAIVAEGKIYPSITLAAEAIGLTRPAISYRIKIGREGYAMHGQYSAEGAR
jgi:group I intron endonuclease